MCHSDPAITYDENTTQEKTMGHQTNTNSGNHSDGESSLCCCVPHVEQNTPDHGPKYKDAPHSLTLQMNTNVPDQYVFPNASNFIIKDSTFIYGGIPQGSFPIFLAYSFNSSCADECKRFAGIEVFSSRRHQDG
jgi:hypothetical protein